MHWDATSGVALQRRNTVVFDIWYVRMGKMQEDEVLCVTCRMDGRRNKTYTAGGIYKKRYKVKGSPLPLK